MAEDLTKLIDDLKCEGVLHTPDIADAFLAVDRKDFIPAANHGEAYGDYPISIGHGQTISQPYTVAFMLELLEPRKGEKILDIGSGSGWTTALLAHIVGRDGHVYGTEIVPELVLLGKENIAKYPALTAEIRKATGELGFRKEAPYDKILVSAGDMQLPQELVEQLTVGGILVIPILNAIWKITRTGEEETEVEKHEGFAFVPLIRD